LSDFELVIDVVAAGGADAVVTVSVFPGVVTVCVLVFAGGAPASDVVVVVVVSDAASVLVVVGSVAVSDLAGPVALFICPVAVEIALLACCAALDAASLAAPDPHPVTSAAVIPSTSATRSSGVLDMELIPAVSLDFVMSGPNALMRRGCAQWGGHVSALGGRHTGIARRDAL
jgi:hypothetical protein